jgi:hypothetical protein
MTSGGRRSGWRRSSGEPLEVGEPDLDEREHRLLEAGLPGDRERLLVALPDFLRGHTLLEAVVTVQEEIVDLRSRGVLVDDEYLSAAWPTVSAS